MVSTLSDRLAEEHVCTERPARAVMLPILKAQR